MIASMRLPVLILALLLAAPAAGAERVRAELTCAPIPGEDLDYACTVQLTEPGGRPADGIDLTLGADMPSMPMAHNVSPVKARPAGPGRYEATLKLEMHGVWAVKLRLGPPRDDLIVRRLRFEPGKVVPARDAGAG